MDREDGIEQLKNEIAESFIRVKAAKGGMNIDALSPQHANKFFLPEKKQYANISQPNEQSKLFNLQSRKSSSRRKPTVDSNYASRVDRDSSMARIDSRSTGTDKRPANKSFGCDSGKLNLSKNTKPCESPLNRATSGFAPTFSRKASGYTDVNVLTENSSPQVAAKKGYLSVGHSFRSKRISARAMNNLSMDAGEQRIPQRKNELYFDMCKKEQEKKYLEALAKEEENKNTRKRDKKTNEKEKESIVQSTKVMMEDPQIQLVSLIDSKPISPYLKLVSLKEIVSKIQPTLYAKHFSSTNKNLSFLGPLADNNPLANLEAEINEIANKSAQKSPAKKNVSFGYTQSAALKKGVLRSSAMYTLGEKTPQTTVGAATPGGLTPGGFNALSHFALKTPPAITPFSGGAAIGIGAHTTANITVSGHPTTNSGSPTPGGPYTNTHALSPHTNTNLSPACRTHQQVEQSNTHHILSQFLVTPVNPAANLSYSSNPNTGNAAAFSGAGLSPSASVYDAAKNAAMAKKNPISGFAQNNTGSNVNLATGEERTEALLGSGIASIIGVGNMSDLTSIALTKAERVKREGDKKHDKNEQAFLKKKKLYDFNKRGGFSYVLANFFNAFENEDQNEQELNIDALSRVKDLCKDFYMKKGEIKKNLIQTLDAIANERPSTIRLKKKCFSPLVRGGNNNNVYEDMGKIIIFFIRI